jgi:arylsulfatase A-like enzyme
MHRYREEPMTTRPNVLWICTDQQRWDTLGCYGNPWTATPNLDRLAASGVIFEQAYSQSPVCTPSRASFLTGRYPRTTRCRQNGQSIPAEETLVTRILADAGYIGGLSGKLHLSACHPSTSPGTEHRVADGYDEFHWSHHPAPDWPTNEYTHWLHEQGTTYRKTPVAGTEYVQAGMPEPHHHTTWCAQKAIDFIETNAGFDNPWQFSINTYDPHHPFDPPPEYLNRYLDRLEEIPLPDHTDGELDTKPIFQRIDHQGAYGGDAGYAFTDMNPDDHRMLRSAYWAMCDLIDAQVGRILTALEHTGQLTNTLVIFMTDHGEMLGDHGIYLKGPYFYEPAIHIPLILSWPGVIAGGRRSPALVELIDIAPTLLDAAGLPRHPGIQGRSLWPMLTGQADLDHHHDDIYSEYYNAMPWHNDPAPHLTMLRTATHKLTIAHGLATGELYNLREDPDEHHNHWNDPNSCEGSATEWHGPSTRYRRGKESSDGGPAGSDTALAAGALLRPLGPVGQRLEQTLSRLGGNPQRVGLRAVGELAAVLGGADDAVKGCRVGEILTLPFKMRRQLPRLHQPEEHRAQDRLAAHRVVDIAVGQPGADLGLVATRDVRMFDVLSHLPAGLRRRAVVSALGLNKG